MTPAPARLRVSAITVGLASLLLFCLLGSQQYTAVDGALRCLEVFRHPALSFGGNNHLLYPVDVLTWHRLLAVFGVRAADPLSYLWLTQLMNAAAAAGCVALVYWIVRTVTAADSVALGVAAGLALSRAFLLHATNAAEPMMGLFWALVSLATAIVALRRGSGAAAAATGVVLAIAFASYASMALVAPALCLLLLVGHGARRRLGALVLAGALTTVAIYGFAYVFSGTATPGAMLSRFFALPGTSVWGGFGASKLANFPMGFVQAFLPVLPPGYGGLRWLVDAGVPALRLAGLIAALLGVAALWGALAWSAFRAREKTERDRAILLGAAAGAVGLAAAIVAPLAWDPLYDKLWLLPVALAWILGGSVLAGTRRGPRLWLAWGGSTLVAVEAVLNLAWAVPAHWRESPYLEPARVVAQAVKPPDLVVTDWDPVSEMYAGLWGADATTWSLPTQATRLGPAALVALDSAVSLTRRRGGAVYFLGVLDETPAAWEAFLGRRLHLPYASLNRYRDSATVVSSLGPPSAPLTLRRL